MLNKDDLCELMLFECDVAKHLHGKLPQGCLDYRPTPGQRSTLELLRYLAHCGISGCYALWDGNWDRYGASAARTQEMSAEEFPAVMDRQKQEIRAFFDAMSPEDFATRPATEPTGVTTKLCRALVDMPLRWLGGYRMQLFLYAKAAGNAEIGTANCWAGIDWPKES